ncbi:hypothetical protein [Nocardiopsis halotolerans]|uniref:hypothetical protein n=1 Tax=Nocardiopsis halotolerans TaxID=124252 RepID=UPI0003449E1B|nr:hypothetical protein [Nocardiopsis halotolerans]
MRQTCVLMFAAVPAYGFLAYLAGDRMLSGPSEDLVGGLRVLMVLAALVGLVLAALALPVRRGGDALCRAAQVTAVVGMGVAPAGLYTAARLADTPLLLAGLLVAAVTIIVNIALWSTGVRRWCGLGSPRISERDTRGSLGRWLRGKLGR